MKKLIAILSLLLLTGCGNLELNEVTSMGAATGAAVITSAIIPNPMVIGIAAASAGTTTAILTEPNDALSVEAIESIENPWQAMAVGFDALMNHAFELVIAFGVAMIGIPMVLSYVLGRAKQRPEDRKQIGELVERVAKMKDK